MKRSFDFLTLIRTFSKKIINKINISYDFNKKIVNYTIDFNNLKYFWTFMIIINKSILFNYYQLNDITCIDNLNLIDNNNDSIRNRFTLIYVFTNIKKNSRLTIRITINNNQRVPSLVNLFDAANWLEREVYDLFGIIFSNHPDLRRILTDYGFTNHPLLKDFPLTVI
jgi:NADH:ubiquinone oxidoreductase subunit C